MTRPSGSTFSTSLAPSSAVENASKQLETTLIEAGKAASANYTSAIASDLKAAKADAETLRSAEALLHTTVMITLYGFDGEPLFGTHTYSDAPGAPCVSSVASSASWRPEVLAAR